MKMYLAGPLFTQAEQNWLRDLKSQIEALAKDAGSDIDVVWPGDLVSPEDVEKWGENANILVTNALLLCLLCVRSFSK